MIWVTLFLIALAILSLAFAVECNRKAHVSALSVLHACTSNLAHRVLDLEAKLKEKS
jgi:hypothetical protein